MIFFSEASKIDPRTQAPGDRIMQRGVPCCSAIIQVFVKHLESKSGDKLEICDLNPEYNLEWAIAAFNATMEHNLSGGGLSTYFSAYVDDKEECERFNSNMEGTFVKEWWPKQASYSKRYAIARTVDDIEKPLLELFAFGESGPTLPQILDSKFSEDSSFFDAWTASLTSARSKVDSMMLTSGSTQRSSLRSTGDSLNVSLSLMPDFDHDKSHPQVMSVDLQEDPDFDPENANLS